MKKFVCLCTIAAVLFTLAASVFASDMAGQPITDGITDAPFDAGISSRTGDITDGSNPADMGENAAESGEIPSETGNSGDISGESAPESTADEVSSGTSWFAVILSIIIVAAIIALVVALIPRRRNS